MLRLRAGDPHLLASSFAHTHPARLSPSERASLLIPGTHGQFTGKSRQNPRPHLLGVPSDIQLQPDRDQSALLRLPLPPPAGTVSITGPANFSATNLTLANCSCGPQSTYHVFYATGFVAARFTGLRVTAGTSGQSPVLLEAGGSVTIINSSFIGGRAAVGRGGALSVARVTALTLQGSVFLTNSAQLVGEEAAQRHLSPLSPLAPIHLSGPPTLCHLRRS